MRRRFDIAITPRESSLLRDAIASHMAQLTAVLALSAAEAAARDDDVAALEQLDQRLAGM